MSLPGHSASRSLQLHAISSERGEMEAFLLEEEKFLVADASRSAERRSPTTTSNLGVGKPAVAGYG